MKTWMSVAVASGVSEGAINSMELAMGHTGSRNLGRNRSVYILVLIHTPIDLSFYPLFIIVHMRVGMSLSLYNTYGALLCWTKLRKCIAFQF